MLVVGSAVLYDYIALILHWNIDFNGTVLCESYADSLHECEYETANHFISPFVV